MLEVFTTILVKNGQLCWLDAHLNRLWHHAKQIGFSIPPTPFFQERDSKPHLLRLSINERGYSLKRRDFVPPPAEATVYLSSQIATSQIKTNQRAVYDLAYQQARKQGAFEGLLLNKDGYLVDGSRSSLFVLKDTSITLLEGGIEGITRQQVALQAQKLGFKIKRAYLKPDQIEGQLWLAGTGVGILSVTDSQNLVAQFSSKKNPIQQRHPQINIARHAQ